MKIMIVDDCLTTRKLLGIYLKVKGLEVVFAENGLEALEKLATSKVKMIITDLNMPYMDGIELIKNLRADPNCVDIPVLMMTTEADPEERERAITAGANGYIIKPVTADMVTQTIKDILKDFFGGGGVSNARL
ncbi:MAG TPA: two-component system response regulator [Nitrospiraceae bacterium]|jgi:two-component system chemotaxis response regulator CheY|nr:two-component system response regulator [Nitrospiraceae bacterium]